MPESKQPSAAAVIIGDEILSGRTRDKNINELAKTLDSIGVRLQEVRIVRDDSSAIQQAVNELRAIHDQVFTSGGIGPTHDDITADSIAAAFGVPISVRSDARAILEAHYPPARLNESRLRMARIPDGAELIPNPVSAAPGFRIENVWVMAGVPAIFEAMLAFVSARISGGPRIESRSLSASVPEGAHAADLRQLAGRFPDLEIGSYPFARAGILGTTVVVRGTDKATVAQCASEVRNVLKSHGAAEIHES